MRTMEQFLTVWDEVKWFTRFHNKPVWLVPLENGYAISIVKPTANELPEGTCSNLYNLDQEPIETVWALGK